MGDGSWLGLILAKLSAFLEFRRFDDPKYRSRILIGAVGFLIAGVVLSLYRQPAILQNLDWRPVLLVIALAVPVTIGLNALEFVLTGRLVGRRIAHLRSLEVAILGTAGNMLPLPGGALVRVASLNAAGARYRDGTSAVLVVAFTWLGIALLYAGAAILLATGNLLGWLFVVLALAVLPASMVVALRVGSGLKTYALIVGVKLLLVINDAARIFLCLTAMGLTVSFAQASTFAISGVFGAAVSIVPAGLGVREAVAAVLSPVAGLAVASGFLATAMNRLLELVTIIPLATLLALRNRYQESHQ